MFRSKPSTNPSQAAPPACSRRSLRVAATTTLARHGLGLFGLATMALFAALILTACGPPNTTALRTDGSRSATSPEPQITSEAVELPASEPLVPRLADPSGTSVSEQVPVAAEVDSTEPESTGSESIGSESTESEHDTASAPPADLVATLDDVSWSLDENPFQSSWSDEQKEQWRRSLFMFARLEMIEIFLATNRLERGKVVAAIGPLPSPDASTELQLKVYVDIYNHADEIEVLPVNGQPTFTLDRWFREVDILSQSTYNQMSFVR